MIIYGGRDETVGTSLLGASNLLVLRVSKLGCLLYLHMALIIDFLANFLLAGVLSYTFECKPWSSRSRFIKFVWSWRLY